VVGGLKGIEHSIEGEALEGRAARFASLEGEAIGTGKQGIEGPAPGIDVARGSQPPTHRSQDFGHGAGIGGKDGGGLEHGLESDEPKSRLGEVGIEEEVGLGELAGKAVVRHAAQELNAGQGASVPLVWQRQKPVPGGKGFQAGAVGSLAAEAENPGTGAATGKGLDSDGKALGGLETSEGKELGGGIGFPFVRGFLVVDEGEAIQVDPQGNQVDSGFKVGVFPEQFAAGKLAVN